MVFNASVIVLIGLSNGCIRKTADAEPVTQPAQPTPEPTAAPLSHPEPSGSGTLTVAVSERHQQLVGFGAAVGWYIDRLVGATPDEVYRLLFPELGLDILRFRNRFDRAKPNDRDLTQEVEILRRATEAAGRPPKILMSSWTPPARLKASGREDCHGEKDCTLLKREGRFVYDLFAQYWLDALGHYASLGIVPEWVSLQNEPDFLPTGWEGCRFEPTETPEFPGYDRALAAVHAKLATLPSPPKLIGPEVLGIHGQRVQNYLKAMNLDLVDAIASHLYERGSDGVPDWKTPGPDSYLDPMRGVASAVNQPIFQTEFSTEEDEGTGGGFEIAWLIHNALVEEGVSMFLYWDLIWKAPGGLVSIENHQPTIRDQYYSLKHYARFTDPGYVRVGASSDAPELRASAFLSPDGKQLSLVVLNTDMRTLVANVEAGEFAGAACRAYRTVYRPGKSERWRELGDPRLEPLSMPGRSVVTVVCDERPE